MAKRLIRPYGDTTGDGMVQLSFTLPMPHSKIAEGAAVQLANKMGMDPALVVHAKPMGPDFTFFVVYGRVQPPRRPLGGRGRRARLRAADPQGGQRGRQGGAAPPPGGRRRLHRHRRPHGRHRRDPEHQGVRGGEGPGVLPRAQGGQPRRPGLRAPARRARGRGEGRRRPGLPGRHPARRPPAQHPRDVGGLPRGLPARAPAAAGRRRPPLRRDDGRRRSASTASSPGVRRRARWPATSCTGSSPRGRPHDHARGRDRASIHRRYVSYADAHYAGNLVDGAWGLGLFGDVAPRCASAPTATRACSRRTPTCSSCAPVRAGDVRRGQRHPDPGRPPLARDRLRAARGGPRRRPGRPESALAPARASPSWPRPRPAPSSSRRSPRRPVQTTSRRVQRDTPKTRNFSSPCSSARSPR